MLIQNFKRRVVGYLYGAWSFHATPSAATACPGEVVSGDCHINWLSGGVTIGELSGSVRVRALTGEVTLK